MDQRMDSWKYAIVLVLFSSAAFSQPLNNTTGSNCSNDDDCASDTICVDLKCVDRCQGVCGQNAVCLVQEQTPICSCKLGYIGDPLTECNSTETGDCVENTQCPPDKACINQKCEDPCQGSCGLNTNCRVVNHRPVCACLRGFNLSPTAGCKPISVPECQANHHCADDRSCRRQKCVDPCEEEICGNNTMCYVKNHHPVCACKVGFVGDAIKGCVQMCLNPPQDKRETSLKILLLIKEAKAWISALNDCYKRGMYLASINNEEEWEEVIGLVSGSGASNFWLGGHDLGQFNNFVWVSTGESLSYTKWSPGEPSGSQYHCLLARTSDHSWMSHNCDNVYPYVCRYRPSNNQ